MDRHTRCAYSVIDVCDSSFDPLFHFSLLSVSFSLLLEGTNWKLCGAEQNREGEERGGGEHAATRVGPPARVSHNDRLPRH